jgi:hypothetical protein
MASDTSCSVWAPEVPQTIPERSRLYSLNPIGTGTPQVESLTGYIARLAEAHVLSVGDMVGRDPLCIARAGLHRRTVLFQKKRPNGHAFHAAAYTINGISASAQKWVRVFERLTCVRCDIRCPICCCSSGIERGVRIVTKRTTQKASYTNACHGRSRL